MAIFDDNIRNSSMSEIKKSNEILIKKYYSFIEEKATKAYNDGGNHILIQLKDAHPNVDQDAKADAIKETQRQKAKIDLVDCNYHILEAARAKYFNCWVEASIRFISDNRSHIGNEECDGQIDGVMLGMLELKFRVP